MLCFFLLYRIQIICFLLNRDIYSLILISLFIHRYSKSPNADDVYVTGSMTDWQCVKMSKPPGEAAWVHIIDTRNVFFYIIKIFS